MMEQIQSQSHSYVKFKRSFSLETQATPYELK